MAELPTLLEAATRSAVHLEMRDTYEAIDPDWLEWRDGHQFDPAVRWAGWFDLVRRTAARGVVFRRARVVTEPVTDYIRYEYAVTAAHNVAAGEEVRWLPRSAGLDLLVPLVDFWVVDGEIVIINHFDTQGQMTEERRDDLAGLYASSFSRVWRQAIPHADYLI